MLVEIISGACPSYPTIKPTLQISKWEGHMWKMNEHCTGRPISVTTPENIDYDMILGDRRVGLKPTAESQLAHFLQTCVSHPFHSMNDDQKRVCLATSKKIVHFKRFRSSCYHGSIVTRNKIHYQRQKSNRKNGSILVFHEPKKCVSENWLAKIVASVFSDKNWDDQDR